MARNPVLVTGAFGNLGQVVLHELAARGIPARATDLDSRRNRRIAARLGCRDAIFADLRALDFEPLLEGARAVIHLGAVLPPLTESSPALAHDINVKPTLRLIDAIGRRASKPVLVYPSSVTVFGTPQPRDRLMRADDPVAPSDHYTRHKVEIERSFATSDIPWVVLRVGVSVDARTLGADLSMLRQLFRVAPDNPLEWVHPKDVATALVHATESPRAAGRILLVGGGAECRVTQHRFLSAALSALGVSLPRDALGSEPYYTAWMDTAEGQEILRYQRHRFADYERELRERLRLARRLAAPAAPLLLWALRRLLAT